MRYREEQRSRKGDRHDWWRGKRGRRCGEVADAISVKSFCWWVYLASVPCASCVHVSVEEHLTEETRVIHRPSFSYVYIFHNTSGPLPLSYVSIFSLQFSKLVLPFKQLRLLITVSHSESDSSTLVTLATKGPQQFKEQEIFNWFLNSSPPAFHLSFVLRWRL